MVEEVAVLVVVAAAASSAPWPCASTCTVEKSSRRSAGSLSCSSSLEQRGQGGARGGTF